MPVTLPPLPAQPPAAATEPDPAPSPAPPRLLDRLRHAIRLRHYSIRTEDTYVDWARRYIRFHDKRHPGTMGAAEVETFLSYLATVRSVAPATQNQAKSALLFLYKEVLQVQLPWLDEVVVAKDRQRLPIVLTPFEVSALLHQLTGTAWLVGSLLYGTGMRLLEGLRLRVHDVEFERREVVVRNGKGAKDRVTVLPENLMLPLQQQLMRAKVLHEKDVDVGRGKVMLPDALASKYPNAAGPGAGNGSFRALRSPSIRAPASSAATTFTKLRSRRAAGPMPTSARR